MKLIDDNTLIHNGQQYKAVVTTATFRKCEGCAFEQKPVRFYTDNCETLNCCANYRQDNNNIILERTEP